LNRRSVFELLEALRKRYLVANKSEKGRMLEEFCQNTGYHRKAAIRALNHPQVKERTKRGPVRQYGPLLAPIFLKLWRASDCICSKRLQPFIPALLVSLESHGELQVEPEESHMVLQASASTIDRILRPYRKRRSKQPLSQSKSVYAIRSQVPLRTFGEWAGAPVGSVQADLVALCGGTTEGFYLNTLLGVDVCTGWLGLRAVWGKTQTRVAGAIETMRRELPFPLLHLHTDNGGEFLNRVLYPWLKAQNIQMSRGRPYRKNDQAYAEQRNFYIVRRFIGYGRYSTREAYEKLTELCRLVVLYNNFFQPMSKVVDTQRQGAKVKRTYDIAQTPFQRLVTSGVLNEQKGRSLEQLFKSTNPVQLLEQIEDARRSLWYLADPDGANHQANTNSGDA